MAASRKSSSVLPSKADLLDYIRETPGRLSKRDIARAFGIKGADRVELKAMIRSLQDEGHIAKGPGKRFEPAAGLPSVTTLEVIGTDADGEVLARPTHWRREGEPPRIFVVPDRRGHPSVGEGQRILARLRRRPDGDYEARIMKRLARAPQTVLGQYRLAPDGGRVQPTDRRLRHELVVARGDTGGARDGELVLAETVPGKALGLRRARVVERLGDLNAPRSVSLIAIHAQEIPTEFSTEALAQAKAAKPVGLDGRIDLRDLPLVTIDGADARDFDDAVWAEPDSESGGWHAVVAIADVAHYVRPSDALDRDAYERGNSVYFPDRVVPMLPEALSNDLCSLRPERDRACLAVHLHIAEDGKLKRHRFERGLMRSAARLTYEQVQAAHDGKPDKATEPLLDTVIEPLYGVFAALHQARQARGALEIELPERKVEIDDDGRVAKISPRPRFDSHRLIEELMIAANVAAAETLEARHQPCMYRVHEPPDPVKIHALGDFLRDLGYRLTKSQTIRPAQLNQVLDKARGTGEERLINEVVLRCQSQAVYSPDNKGHFGLGLRRYAHFTSPIRRYADLLVHRALIWGLELGTDPAEDGLEPFDSEAESAAFAALGAHISTTERRAMIAERDAMDRYMANYLADRVGGHFEGRINGVTRFGLFVTLEETGADGLVPVRSLSSDYYVHDEKGHRLVGRESGVAYRLGDAVEVRLAEANPVTGGLIFDLVDGAAGSAARKESPRGRRKKAGRRSRGR